MNPSNPQTKFYSDLFRAQQSQAQFIPNSGNSNTYNYGATPLPSSAGQMPMVNNPDLAMIARQGYLQQQQRLAQMGQMGVPNMMPPQGGTPQQGQPPVYMGIAPEMREKQAMEAAARETMLREKAMRDAALHEAAKKRARVSICFVLYCVWHWGKLIKLPQRPNRHQRSKQLRANQARSSHQYQTNNISNLPSLARLLLHQPCLPRPYQDQRPNQ